MKVNRRRVEKNLERSLALGMITNDAFLREMSDIFRPELCATSSFRTIGSWCIDFYRKYGKPPKTEITPIFLRKRQEDPENDNLELVYDLLLSLSDEFQRKEDFFNVDFYADEAVKHFKKQYMVSMSQKIKEAIARGDTEEADELTQNIDMPTRLTQDYDHPLTDIDLIVNTFETVDQPLLHYGGALGFFINDYMCRDSFVAFLAIEKRGKTWRLMDMTRKALLARKNVAFIQAGDLSKQQATRRFHISLARKSNRQKYCGHMLIPCLDCVHNQTGECNLQWRSNNVSLIKKGKIPEFGKHNKNYKPCTYCSKMGDLKTFKGGVWYKERKPVKPLSAIEGIKYGRAFAKRCGGDRLRMATYPSGSLSLVALESLIKRWYEHDGWLPDVVVLDYADLLAAPNNVKDARHAHDANWKGLRRISQQYHCLVLTATQADAAAYDLRSLTMQNFTEDKRKMAHVTAMLALNQTPQEKKEGLMRIGHIVARDDDFDILQEVTCVQSLAIGRPCLGSFF